MYVGYTKIPDMVNTGRYTVTIGCTGFRKSKIFTLIGNTGVFIYGKVTYM